MIDEDLIPPEPPQDNVGGPDKQPKRKRSKSPLKKVEGPKVQTEPVPVVPAGKRERIQLTDLRANVSAPKGATDRNYDHVPVRKPGDQKCIRTFPQEQWFRGAAIVEREGSKERNKPYLFSGEMAEMVSLQVKRVTLAPYVDTQLNLFLWPLKHNSLDHPNDFNSTALHCAEMALTEWGHILNTGGHYGSVNRQMVRSGVSESEH
jgi:hypothetical protein